MLAKLQDSLDKMNCTSKKAGPAAVRLNILGTIRRLLDSILTCKGLSLKLNENESVKASLLEELKNSIFSGNDLLSKNRQQMNPLHIAARNGNALAVESLLLAKVDHAALDKAEHSPLDLATNERCIDVLKQVGADGWTKLMVAAEKDEPGTLRDLLASQSFDVMARTRRGRTALHAAAERGCINAIRILVDSGAEVNAADVDSQTPLDLCTDSECIEVLTLSGGARSRSILAGEEVKLSASYMKFEDAAEGPLHLGDIGVLVKDDGSDKPYLVRAADGTEWYYCRCAIVPSRHKQ